MSSGSAVRSVAVGVLLIVVTASVVPWTTDIFPSELWFWPRVANAMFGAAVFAIASFALGARLLTWLTPGPRRDGQLALAWVTGLFGFALGLMALGHLQLFGPATFWLFPAALVALCADALVVETTRLFREVKETQLAWWEWLFLIVGGVGVLLAVLPTFAPMNLNYDARWYHVGIGELYAAAGGIERSTEGNLTLTSPHLVSVWTTWAMLRPNVAVIDRVLLAQQLEVVSFIATLCTLPALVRAVAPDLGRVTRWAWVALLLFPSLYIYDTGLFGAADHAAAAFVCAAVLAWVQATKRHDGSSYALVAALTGAVVLTKHTASFFVIPFVAFVALGVVGRAVERRSARALSPLFVALVAGLAVTTPLWLRNLIWYHNPLYPFAGTLFPSTPWTQDSAVWAARFYSDNWAARPATFTERITGTLTSLWRYHLELYTYEIFTKRLPIFGSLFSAAVVAVPFVRRSNWLWALVAMVHVGIALWWNLSHQLRYLLVFVPVMAAVAFVTFTRVWSLGWAARVGVVVLVGAQLSVAAGIPFIKSHGMNGFNSPVGYAIDLFGEGHASSSPKSRLTPFSDWESLGQSLPPKARVLFHNRISMTGFGRVALTDEPGLQYGLGYASLGTAKAIHGKLLELGVSHVAWRDEGPPDSVEGELLFRAFATRDLVNHTSRSGWNFAELGPVPTTERGDGVFYSGCGGTYATGLYHRDDLRVPVGLTNYPAPRIAGTLESVNERAQYAVIESSCAGPSLDSSWQQIGQMTQNNAPRRFYIRAGIVAF